MDRQEIERQLARLDRLRRDHWERLSDAGRTLIDACETTRRADRAALS